MILAQVPLARFLRVPTRHSYSRVAAPRRPACAPTWWCATQGSQVLAVVDIRRRRSRVRAQRNRHERMTRVLQAAQHQRAHLDRRRRCRAWPRLRAQMAPLLQDGPARLRLEPAAARAAMPLIAGGRRWTEILARGDVLAQDIADASRCRRRWFDDLDALPGADRHRAAAPLIRAQPSSACANSRALNVCRSSSFSPTPMKYTAQACGAVSQRARAPTARWRPARRPWPCRRAW